MAERKRKPGSAGGDSIGKREVHSTISTDSSSPEVDSDWFEIVFSLPWIVQQVESGQDAINIAVSEVGKRVSSAGDSIQNVDIGVQRIFCGDCGTENDALLIVSGTAIVGLTLRVEAKGEDRENAEIDARRKIGPFLPNTPLQTLDS
ncbi:DUF555 domain-containing protein (plasmid) [Halorientalis pallida]|uniref:DUF555 domain-containing protein n=1 Tax=Halorientalis pallida TaxID=2479928 RepID=UPI003C6F0FA7